MLYILEALRHNYVTGYLRLSLRCARLDKCNFMYRHLPDLEADISSSRLSHWLCRRMSTLFCSYESLIKESLSGNRKIAIVILLQTTILGWPERHVDTAAILQNIIWSRLRRQFHLRSRFTCSFARIFRQRIGCRKRMVWETNMFWKYVHVSRTRLSQRSGANIDW